MLVGIDMSQEVIDIASTRFATDARATFVCGDVANVRVGAVTRVDYALISGALYRETQSVAECNERVETILRVAWQCRVRALAFNMMNEFAVRRRPNAGQLSCDGQNVDPAVWFRFAMSEFSPRVQLVSDYHDLDYTLSVHRVE